MSALSRSCARFSSIISSSRNNRRFSSRGSIFSSSVRADQTPQPPSGPPPVAESTKSSWSFLKFSLLAAVTGGIATSGYATYAYTVDEVDQKAKDLRALAKYTVSDDASSLDKNQAYVRAAAVAVPAKLVDVYLDLRRLAEEQIKGFTEPTSDKLLPDLHPLEQRIFTLVLGLNETLIYSDWTDWESLETSKG